jgi:hypothetical protein
MRRMGWRSEQQGERFDSHPPLDQQEGAAARIEEWFWQEDLIFSTKM